MPSRCGRVSRLKYACCACIIIFIIHIFINVHHAVSFSSFTIPIKRIFVETLLKFHGTSSNKPITNVTHWVVNGANVEIPSTCAYMCRNLTWSDKKDAFTVWEDFKAQGYMSCPHNIWDHPHFHQRSSCSLIVIIPYSHQRKICPNSLEM